MIVGIDEVGRGPWAGPLVVGAVVLNGVQIAGLTDSKILSPKRRAMLAAELLASDASVGLGWVHADELDKVGMSKALVEATKRALNEITVPYHEIIIDGTVNFLADTNKGDFVTLMKKADLLVPSVSAASIIAKVVRDEYMASLDDVYPGYDFASHAGYGTAKHRAAIDTLGLSPVHRRSFKPLQDKTLGAQSASVTSRQRGDTAESIATAWLENEGYTVIERNWKTRMCEIDIVARSPEGTLICVEVKHRTQAGQGGGLAAITPKKYHQMEFAAKIYLHYHRMDNNGVQLAVITTTGEPSIFESFLLIE